jgi:hypothetical protein
MDTATLADLQHNSLSLSDVLKGPFPQPIRVDGDGARQQTVSIPPYLKPTADLRNIPEDIGSYGSLGFLLVAAASKQLENRDLSLGSDQLAAIWAAQNGTARRSIHNEQDGLQFLADTIFPFVTLFLGNFDESAGLRLQSQGDDDQGIGTRVLWVDDKGIRVIWHQLSPAVADYIFPRLKGRVHDTPTETEIVKRGSSMFYDAQALIVKVLLFLLDLYINLIVTLKNFSRTRYKRVPVARDS